VIRSFNDDKPYSRFVQEQIAGDVLFPGEPDGIVGLGFLAAGPWDFIGHVEVPETKIDGKVARNLDRDEMVTNTLNTFCSVTVQCARCHNHKFAPFTPRHYYSLQSIFAAVDRAERTYDLDPAIERRRFELETSLSAAQNSLKELDRQLAVITPILLQPMDDTCIVLRRNAKFDLITQWESKPGPDSREFIVRRVQHDVVDRNDATQIDLDPFHLIGRRSDLAVVAVGG